MDSEPPLILKKNKRLRFGSWLRTTLTQNLKDQGFLENPYVCFRCLAIPVIEVDVSDLLEEGDEHHLKKETLPRRCYRGNFDPRKTCVWPDIDGTPCSLCCRPSVTNLCPEKIFLSLAKTVDEQMLKRVQGVLGGSNWLATAGRPDLAEAASTTPGSCSTRRLMATVTQAQNIICNSEDLADSRE